MSEHWRMTSSAVIQGLKQIVELISDAVLRGCLYVMSQSSSEKFYRKFQFEAK